MSVTVTKSVTSMLWPDGRLDIPDEIRRQLGIEGSWQCSLEIVDGALVVRPVVEIPEEDLWAYEPETHARLLKAAQQAVGSGISLSEDDIKDVLAGRVAIDDLFSQSKS